MNGSEWPEVAKAVDGGLFVLAEAACLESRSTLQHGNRLPPAGLGPHATWLPGAGRHAHAGGPSRACGRERVWL